MATDGAPPLPSSNRLWRACFARSGAWRPWAAADGGGRAAGRRVTMVIDKGTPLGYFLELLEVAAPHVTFWKLAFGSAALYAPEQVRRRVERAREAGVEVYAGGTLVEIAREMGDLKTTLEELQRLGFRWVELSDGTFPLSGRRRDELIRRAVDRGFSVVTEVGSKDPGRPLVPEEAAARVEADLEQGACYVLVEARDSGRGVGLYDEQGRLRRKAWEALFRRLRRPDRVIWEAPHPEQQRELLLLLGPAVNLGNVQVGDVLTLAAMRWGLRSDTLRVWAAAGGDGGPEAGAAGPGRVDGPLRQE